MAFQMLLNVMIACIWMFLVSSWSASACIVGYLIGLMIITAFRRFFPGKLYLVKLWAIAKLLTLFLKELLISSYAVVHHIISPKLNIRPGIFVFKTELKSDWEVTLLACLICLTPGTLTLEVSRGGQMLFIHAMDIEDAHMLSHQIKETFEKAIMEVTRS